MIVDEFFNQIASVDDTEIFPNSIVEQLEIWNYSLMSMKTVFTIPDSRVFIPV